MTSRRFCWYPGTMNGATWFEIEEKLPLVPVPTLWMCGAYDWNVRPDLAIEQVDQVARLIGALAR